MNNLQHFCEKSRQFYSRMLAKKESVDRKDGAVLKIAMLIVGKWVRHLVIPYSDLSYLQIAAEEMHPQKRRLKQLIGQFGK